MSLLRDSSYLCAPGPPPASALLVLAPVHKPAVGPVASSFLLPAVKVTAEIPPQAFIGGGSGVLEVGRFGQLRSKK